jgi:hypothetical protein
MRTPGSLGPSTALAALAALATAAAAEAPRPIPWPNGARAAVVLTYDDAMDTHLDHAAPDLEAASLRGTFFLPGHSESLAKRLPEWRALAARGHELGNHAIFHPCLRKPATGPEREWVRPEYALEGYTVERLRDEAAAMNTTLLALDGESVRTFAYNCGTPRREGGPTWTPSARSSSPPASATTVSSRTSGGSTRCSCRAAGAVRHGLLLGRGAQVLAAARRLLDVGRLRRRLHAEPDLRGGLLRPHRPRRGRARRLRPGDGRRTSELLRSSGRATTRRRGCARATTSARSTARRSTARRGAARGRGGLARAYQAALAAARLRADHDRDRRRARVLLRRGLPPAVPGEEPGGYCGLGGTGVACPRWTRSCSEGAT